MMSSTLQNVSPGLICEAQLGNQGSMERLAEVARERLFAYVYRLTLDQHLTQDILQETILFMIQSLNQLEHVDQFWHWLFRTALGKVQHHYRELKRRKTVELSEAERLRIHHRVSVDLNDGLTELLRKELSDAVFKAMKRLKLKYRNILVLRCFENLDYAEIAALMDCSEIRSRVLFFRAKSSLRRQLAVQGFGRHYLLLALALFGLITTSAKAASSTAVTAASLEVGFTASLVAAISSKLGLTAAGGMTALALTLPLETFLYVLAITCFVSLCVFLICLFGIYN
ncbi:MAG: sigma-70 family RNA polymerase sigma factor [Sedimentisphaerales bacterium]|nr:sigma-70 family RNA polymerase sigma factor [Sedimentisphaerales bacterium]